MDELAAAASAAATASNATAGERRSARRRRVAARLGALAVAGALAIGYVGWSMLTDCRHAPSGGEHSIAVLPFDDLSGTGEAEQYARGLHDDLLTRLSGASPASA